jgi:hypothetical protein
MMDSKLALKKSHGGIQKFHRPYRLAKGASICFEDIRPYAKVS